MAADFTLVPTVMHDAAPGDPMWFVERQDDGDNVRLVRMTDVLGAPIFTDFVIDVDDYDNTVAAPQPGGGTFDTGDFRMLNAELRGGRLVATHAVGLDFDGIAGADETSARWYEFDVNGLTPTLTQQGNIDPGIGIHTYFPSIAIAPNGDIGITFMQSAATQFVSMYVAGQKFGDAPGTMSTPALVKAGTQTYSGTRGGDYSGISVDPLTGSFWAANEVIILDSAAAGALRSDSHRRRTS